MKHVSDSSWVDVARTAGDVPDVLKVCLTFLAAWTLDERRALPKDLQPPFAFHSPQNVMDYAFTLVQARLKEDAVSPELDAMTSFFAAAASRLSELLASRPLSERVPFFLKDR